MTPIHYFPKFFGFLAFLVNPIFIYLIFTGKSNKFGNYRFLLLYFATFNLTYSAFDCLLPINIHSYRYCFSVFISGGYFIKNSQLGFRILAARCGLISCSYAILISHFLYGWLVIRKSKLTGKRFKVFMLLSVALCGVFFGFWYEIGTTIANSNQEKKSYIHEDFLQTFGEDPFDMNLCSFLYSEGTPESVAYAWLSTNAMTVISLLSVIFYVIMGTLIIRKLNLLTGILSLKTAQLQKDLLKALTIQTAIPIIVSFSPCLISWYGPAFNIKVPHFINDISVIALSAFPFFDPLAVALCLPVLRKRLF